MTNRRNGNGPFSQVIWRLLPVSPEFARRPLSPPFPPYDGGGEPLKFDPCNLQTRVFLFSMLLFSFFSLLFSLFRLRFTLCHSKLLLLPLFPLFPLLVRSNSFDLPGRRSSPPAPLPRSLRDHQRGGGASPRAGAAAPTGGPPPPRGWIRGREINASCRRRRASFPTWPRVVPLRPAR